MNSNLIPSAQTFNCTHGRVGDFFLSLIQNPKTQRWSWQIVFAGNPRVCPPELNKIIASERDHVWANQCLGEATQVIYKLTDKVFAQNLAKRK